MKNDFFDEIAIIGDGITAKLVAIAFYQIKIMPILISNNKKKYIATLQYLLVIIVRKFFQVMA